MALCVPAEGTSTLEGNLRRTASCIAPELIRMGRKVERGRAAKRAIDDEVNSDNTQNALPGSDGDRICALPYRSSWQAMAAEANK